MQPTVAIALLVILVARGGEAAPTRQELEPRDGYVPVYVRLGDELLSDINPMLAAAFNEEDVHPDKSDSSSSSSSEESLTAPQLVSQAPTETADDVATSNEAAEDKEPTDDAEVPRAIDQSTEVEIGRARREVAPEPLPAPAPAPESTPVPSAEPKAKSSESSEESKSSEEKASKP